MFPRSASVPETIDKFTDPCEVLLHGIHNLIQSSREAISEPLVLVPLLEQILEIPELLKIFDSRPFTRGRGLNIPFMLRFFYEFRRSASSLYPYGFSDGHASETRSEFCSRRK